LNSAAELSILLAMDTLITRTITVVPAYGRDYSKAVDVLADFNAGKDFIIQDFSLPAVPVNKPQFQAGVRVNIRYAKLRKVVVAVA
jgi:hypothetical protein